MRQDILDSLKDHAKGKIAYHQANVEIYLKNPAGIGEHSNIMEAIEVELEVIAKYHEQLDVLNKYFYKES